MHPIDQLHHIIPALTGLVDRIAPAQLGAGTPCDEFTVDGVLDHMMTGGAVFAALFRGEEPGDPAPATYGVVPAAEFRASMDGLLAAICSDGAMERILSTPFGEMDGETLARLVAIDGLVHGWDLAVATGQPYGVDPAVVAAVADFAAQAIGDDVRSTGMFAAPTEAPADAGPVERLAAFTGRTIEPRWRRTSVARHLDKGDIPVKMAVPGATARQLPGFGTAAGYDSLAGEYFSLAAGTDIAPLLHGLDHDMCHAPHWGYMIDGEVVVTFVGGGESVCTAGEIFYWPPGHTVRVTADADVILFSPEHEHVEVLDHMLGQLAAV